MNKASWVGLEIHKNSVHIAAMQLFKILKMLELQRRRKFIQSLRHGIQIAGSYANVGNQELIVVASFFLRLGYIGDLPVAGNYVCRR